jgi:hypothetical protein
VGTLSEDDKSHFRDEEQSLKTAQAMWAGTVTVLSTLGALTLPAVFPATPIIAGAVAVTVLKRKQYAVERVLADPPRSDYWTATHAHRRRYIPGTLGDSPLAIALDQAAIATLRATAYLEASVRADERSQGARIDGHDSIADWHLEERTNHFELALRWSGEMAVALNVLAYSWAAFAVDSGLDEVTIPVDIPERGLSPEERVGLERTGLVTSDLDLDADRREGVRQVLALGRGTVGGVALESAVSTRRLSRATGQVARGRRALPARVGQEAEQLLPSPEGRDAALRGGDVEAATQRLLPAAERGSPDAMFELGLIANATSDHSAARNWLRRAAAVSAPRSQGEYLVQLKRAPEYEQILPPPKQLVEDLQVAKKETEKPDADRVEQYWRALSDNGREVFRAAARIESRRRSGYSLHDIAELLGTSYESVRSMHRSTGRTAKRWRRETGTEEPIRLVTEDYRWDESRKGNRTFYRLPPGVADLILKFPMEED